MTSAVFDHTARVRALQQLMETNGLASAVLSVGADLPYFIGYEAMPSERFTGLVIPVDGPPLLFVPVLEAPRVEGKDVLVRAWAEEEDPIELMSATMPDSGSVLVGDHMWSVFLMRLQEQLPRIHWRPASTVTGQLRMRKDADEVAALGRAAAAVDRVLARIPEELPFGGRSEAEVARDIAGMVVEEGHDQARFWIVASGPNGASPHHEPGGRIVQRGDLVVCDFGGSMNGYFSDVTRTFVVGPPTDEQAQVHSIVREAARAGRDTVKPGVGAQEVDRAAREVIAAAGYGAFFIHRTGHGIGLEVHEHPYIVEGNDRPLEPGMAFSVEPGIYLPGRFGVRIEDIVVVTEDGYESLNTAERALLTVR